MGKNLRQQRTGRGFKRKPSYKYKEKISHQKGVGKITDIIHASGKRPPIAVVDYSGKKALQLAGAGMKVGQTISSPEIGEIPEGSQIYNIELHPGDGGRICKSPGTSATLITKEKGKCIIVLPSKEKKVLSSKCRAVIGSVAGSGLSDKPFRKAGAKFHAMRAMGRLYPRASGVAMNPVDHPFGGSAKPGKHKTVSRYSPPGKKVGSISPRRMGKKKKG